jgi:hypothetical protein
MRQRVWALAALTVVVAACGESGGSGTVTTVTVQQSAPEPQVPATTTSAAQSIETQQAEESVVLGVITSAEVALYTVKVGTRHASLLRRLAPPSAGATGIDISVAAGSDPVACVTWSRNPKRDDLEREVRALSCYGPGESDGRGIVEAGATPEQVAVRPDGSRLAWSDGIFEGNGLLSVAPLDGTSAGTVQSWPGDTAQAPGEEAFTGHGIADLAWAGDTDRLVVSAIVQSDDGAGIALFDTTDADGEWIPEAGWRQPPATLARKGLERLDGVASAGADSALALVRAQLDPPPDRPGSIAVRIVLPKGPLTTVATPLNGRTVAQVSGGERAIVYTTVELESGGGRRHYVRYPGEPVGRPITGVPTDAAIVAGP